MTIVAHAPTTGYRTIRFPLAEHEYERVLTDRPSAKARLQEFYERIGSPNGMFASLPPAACTFAAPATPSAPPARRGSSAQHGVARPCAV
jgi:hypothetical protein